jgi:hypothetical protein
VDKLEELWLGNVFSTRNFPIPLPGFARHELALSGEAFFVHDVLRDHVTDLALRPENNRGTAIIMELTTASAHYSSLGHLSDKVKDDLAVWTNSGES